MGAIAEVTSNKLRQTQAALERLLAETEEESKLRDRELEEARSAYAAASASARMGEGPGPGPAAATQSQLRKAREAVEEIGLTLAGLRGRLEDVKRQAEATEQEEAEAAIAKARAALDLQNARVVALLKEAEDVLFAAVAKWEETERFHRLLGRELPNAMLILGEARKLAALNRPRRIWL